MTLRTVISQMFEINVLTSVEKPFFLSIIQSNLYNISKRN
jgi:hypothetical protein